MSTKRENVQLFDRVNRWVHSVGPDGNTRMSSAETVRALREARTFLQSKMGGSGNTGGNTRRIGRFEVEVSE